MEGNLSQVAAVNDCMIWASRGLVLQLAGCRNYKKKKKSPGVEGGIKRLA
jgi:hypothetical protein